MSEFEELRREIEDLALRSVISDPEEPGTNASGWLSDLERIRGTADLQRAGQVSVIAAGIISALRAAEAEGASGVADTVHEGIARLQEAIEIAQRASPPVEASPARDPELLSDFVLESREHLANIEAQALALEREAGNAEALHAVFRGFHTIKGLAGFLELWEIQELAHEIETVLDRARNRQFTIGAAAIDAILCSADYLRRWLAHVEAGLRGDSCDAPTRDDSLLARIRGLCEAAESPLPAAEAEAAQPAPGLARMAEAVEKASEAQPEAAPAARWESPKAETMAVRVHTAKLDYLVDMAGEMVIAQSLVRHDPDLAGLKSPRLQRNIAQLSRITAELQKTAMAMRLVPIGPLFRRMARLVRDLSRQFGKRVVMETQGDEIELDRNIVEELADPMMHMVRNALDHGIETPAEREQRGKSPSARLLLRGRHHAGQVVIEIADDGRGLNREKILSKAIQKGLVASGEGLSDSEVFNLIFQPGFTTAEQVTNVSGRGVGMDVVRRHVEKLRGRMEIRSVPGQGATFVVKLPLTLAIIEGLVVGVGGERYIAPLFAVREILRPNQDTVWTVQNRAEMALIRGTLLPLLRLYRRFAVRPRSENPLESALLVAEVEGQRFCLMVDELIGKQEVVIKSLGPMFKDVPGIAGGAILGDGRVGLILDLERLYRERNDEYGR